jgi:hypothetical protein
LEAADFNKGDSAEINQFIKGDTEQLKDVSAMIERIKKLPAKATTAKLKTALEELIQCLEKVQTQNEEVKRLTTIKIRRELEANLKIETEKNNYENALATYELAQRKVDFSNTADSLKELQEAKIALDKAGGLHSKATVFQTNTFDINDKCIDSDTTDFCLPPFFFKRFTSLTKAQVSEDILTKLKFETSGLSIGTVLWLYFYERMGIFKILSALMDDYNYRGKYTLSGNRGGKTEYSELMDSICTLYRMGIGSNLRDRVCLYQRVLGVSIDNNLNVESVHNKGFMQTFNKLIDYMLEYYKSKQLAQAIQVQSSLTAPARSSVATQTSIRDTMNLLRQQFEPFEYGRNQMNTFLGIAMVHATLCLINMVRKEIGVPDQYDTPEEFIPAAYDILVTKQSITLNAVNRFIVYDNCASYAYRLITDIEVVNMSAFTTIAVGSSLDTWLNDIEGIVEGYNSAFKSVNEPVTAIL